MITEQSTDLEENALRYHFIATCLWNSSIWFYARHLDYVVSFLGLPHSVMYEVQLVEWALS